MLSAVSLIALTAQNGFQAEINGIYLIGHKTSLTHSAVRQELSKIPDLADGKPHYLSIQSTEIAAKRNKNDLLVLDLNSLGFSDLAQLTNTCQALGTLLAAAPSSYRSIPQDQVDIFLRQLKLNIPQKQLELSELFISPLVAVGLNGTSPTERPTILKPRIPELDQPRMADISEKWQNLTPAVSSPVPLNYEVSYSGRTIPAKPEDGQKQALGFLFEEYNQRKSDYNLQMADLLDRLMQGFAGTPNNMPNKFSLGKTINELNESQKRTFQRLLAENGVDPDGTQKITSLQTYVIFSGAYRLPGSSQHETFSIGLYPFLP